MDARCSSSWATPWPSARPLSGRLPDRGRPDADGGDADRNTGVERVLVIPPEPGSGRDTKRVSLAAVGSVTPDVASASAWGSSVSLPSAWGSAVALPSAGL